MTTRPWTSGPQELLQHALALLRVDGESQRRLALIAADNAVELMLKTYLGLPRRVTGLKITRQEISAARESFPRLLDAVEQHAADKLTGVDLGEFEWFHRLRDELYHQGKGLDIARGHAEVYAELARILFQNLFEVRETKHLEAPENTHRLLGHFLGEWVGVERLVDGLAVQNKELLGARSRTSAPLMALRDLIVAGVIPKRLASDLDELRSLRSDIVHAQIDHRQVLTHTVIRRAQDLKRELAALLARVPARAN